MAFLDNSGDIILDAVLTDAGRARMARGEFRIVKFAFSDEEVGSLEKRNFETFCTKKKSPPIAWQNCHLFVLPEVLYRRQRVACQAE